VETEVFALDESLGIFPASQKIPIDRPSKKTEIHTRVEATGVMQCDDCARISLAGTLDS
jgi:hypothetical protein